MTAELVLRTRCKHGYVKPHYQHCGQEDCVMTQEHTCEVGSEERLDPERVVSLADRYGGGVTFIVQAVVDALTEGAT